MTLIKFDFATDELYNQAGKNWDQTPTKIDPAALGAQGAVPEKGVGAQHFNWLANQQSLANGRLLELKIPEFQNVDFDAPDAVGFTHVQGVILTTNSAGEIQHIQPDGRAAQHIAHTTVPVANTNWRMASDEGRRFIFMTGIPAAGTGEVYTSTSFPMSDASFSSFSFPTTSGAESQGSGICYYNNNFYYILVTPGQVQIWKGDQSSEGTLIGTFPNSAADGFGPRVHDFGGGRAWIFGALGTFQTLTAGAAWSQLNSTTLEQVYEFDGKIYAIDTSGNDFLVSTDGGVSFAPVVGPPFPPLPYSFVPICYYRDHFVAVQDGVVCFYPMDPAATATDWALSGVRSKFFGAEAIAGRLIVKNQDPTFGLSISDRSPLIVY